MQVGGRPEFSSSTAFSESEAEPPLCRRLWKRLIYAGRRSSAPLLSAPRLWHFFGGLGSLYGWNLLPDDTTGGLHSKSPSISDCVEHPECERLLPCTEWRSMGDSNTEIRVKAEAHLRAKQHISVVNRTKGSSRLKDVLLRPNLCKESPP